MTSTEAKFLAIVLSVISVLHLTGGIFFGVSSYQGHIHNPMMGAFLLTLSAIWLAGIAGMTGVRLAIKMTATPTRLQEIAKLAYDCLLGFFVFALFLWFVMLKMDLAVGSVQCFFVGLTSPPALLIVTFAVALFSAIAFRRIKFFWWFADAVFFFLISGVISCWVLSKIILAA